jgi:Concanavalin A-like lectin/glucanases superfamily
MKARKMIQRKFAIWAGAILVTALAVALSVQAAITSGLVGRWIFNEGYGITANDSSGLGNNGTLVSSAYFVTNDPDRGSVLNINGASGEVDFPYTPALEPATGTVTVWVKPTVANLADIVHVNTDSLVRCKMSGLFYAYNLRVDDKGRPFAIIANDSPKTCSKTPQILIMGAPKQVPLNRWTHLAMRWDGSTVSLFANGKRVAASAYDANPTEGLSYHGTDPLKVAAPTPGYTPGFLEYTGAVSDLRIYSRALSDSEIADIAVNGQ